MVAATTSGRHWSLPRRLKIAEYASDVFRMDADGDSLIRLTVSLSKSNRPVGFRSDRTSDTESLGAFRFSPYTSSTGLAANSSRLNVRRLSRTRCRTCGTHLFLFSHSSKFSISDVRCLALAPGIDVLVHGQPEIFRSD